MVFSKPTHYRGYLGKIRGNPKFRDCHLILGSYGNWLLIPKFAHITPELMELHWLPVKFRVEFKIALLVYKALNGLAPQYLSEELHHETLLIIPKVTRKTFGDRAFSHAGRTVWNALPSSLRNCRNIDSFKVQLKTHLFEKAFNL